MGRAAVGDEFTQHGSEPQDDDEGPHDIADAFLNGVDDVADVETGGKAEGDADDGKGDEGVEFNPDDEEDEAGNEYKGEEERHVVKDMKNPPGEPEGIKQLKTNYVMISRDVYRPGKY